MAKEDKSQDVLDVTIKSPSSIQKLVKNKWAMVGISLAVVSTLTGTLLSSGNKPREPRERPTSAVKITPQGMDRQTWQVQSQADIRALAERVQGIEQSAAKQKETIEAQKKTIDEQKDIIKKLEADFKAQNKKISTPPPRVKSVTGDKDSGDEGADVKAETPKTGSTLAPPPPRPVASRNGNAAPERAQADQPIVLRIPKDTKDAVEAKERYTRNQYAGYLPPGSFADVVLLNGLDAGSSDYTRTNPEPILMRIQANATLPGSAKYQLHSCFLIGSGYGDLSSERVHVRLAKLSCVDKNNKLVLAENIKGYIVDSDGSLGLRGKVERRNGQLLANSLLAGFAEGLSTSLGAAQGTTTIGADGAFSSITGSEVMSQSGLSGASNAAQTLSQYYLQEARNIFPVISVPNGRKGTVVITDGVSLKWNDYGSLYIRDVQPVDK